MNRNRFEPASSIFSPCRACPIRCGARRNEGARGRCGGKPGTALVASVVPHFGEEPVISGPRGTAAVFFSGCTMRCIFCQNHQISQKLDGVEYDAEGLADLFLSLEREGLTPLDLVTPTPHLPVLLEAVPLARSRGMRMPVVYNTNTYLTMEAAELAASMSDIALLDLKYSDERSAVELSSAPGYVEASFRAAEIFMERLGPIVIGDDGLARRGVMVRILVLPGRVEEAKAVLRFTAERLQGAYVALLSQYRPVFRTDELARRGLDRPLSRREYDEAVEEAGRLGIEPLLLQEMSDFHLLPDFDEEDPFRT